MGKVSKEIYHKIQLKRQNEIDIPQDIFLGTARF